MTYGIVAIIILGLFYVFIKARRELFNYQEKAEGFVTQIFSSQTYRPEVKTERSYGIPAFSLRFATEEDKNHAESNGLVNQFVENVQILCNDLRPRGEKFDAKRAVVAFSKEDEARWAKSAEQVRNVK